MTAEAERPVAIDPGPYDCVVMAGSINPIPLYPGNRPGRKALVELMGRPLIAYVLDALTASRGVSRIIVVGAPDVLAYAAKWPRVEGVPEGRSLVDNAWRGLEAARTDRVLFCNPDQPLLRAEMVDWFLEHAAELDADLVSSWASEDLLGRYTEGAHKFAAFGDGRFAHGNVFLARKEFPDKRAVRRRLDRLYNARKSNLRFAWQLGPAVFGRFLLAIVTRRLPSLIDTLHIAGERFGITLGAVISPHVELVLDIDEPEDYTAAVRYLSMGSPAGQDNKASENRVERDIMRSDDELGWMGKSRTRSTRTGSG